VAKPTVHTRARCYEVCVLPPGDPYYDRFLIIVEVLNDGYWWVRRSGNPNRLKTDGTWGKDGDGRSARLELEEALAVAQAQAPLMTCGGMDPAEFTAWAERKIAEEGRG